MQNYHPQIEDNQYMLRYKAIRRAIRMLKSEGYTVTKEGSKDKSFDLVAWSNEKTRIIRIITADTGKLQNYDKILEILKKEHVPQTIKRELWVWENSVGWHFYTL